jgi:hypothetical protein
LIFSPFALIINIHKSDADWDIVVPLPKKEEYVRMLTAYLPDVRAVQSDYFSGVTIEAFASVVKLNLIPSIGYDYRIWYLATLAFQEMWKYTGIIDKEQKIAIFESLRASLRGRTPKMNTMTRRTHTYSIAAEARDITIVKPTLCLFNMMKAL